MRFTYQNGTRPLAGYTIHHGIHRGGFGEVYYAHSDGGKEVALKLLHDEERETELRGVAHCLNLKHPNLINIFDVKADDQGDQWVVMEYVSGSNLEDVLAAFPNGLPLGDVREWLSGIVAGVSHLHDRGIVHRDLKPANTYRENGVVKVGDVGLSKQLDSENRRRHTQSVGTVYYMAPEVAQGKYGPEVDVYSLGVMLYEMMTGKLPFTGETTAEILMKHLTSQPDLTPIPAGLRPVLAHALAKDPHKRTPTVRQLELEFLRAVQGSVDSKLEQPSNGRNADAAGQGLHFESVPNRPHSENVTSWTEQVFNQPSTGLIAVAIACALLGAVVRVTGAVRPSWALLSLMGMPILIPLAFREFHRRRRKRATRKKWRESFERFPESLRKGKFQQCATFDGVADDTVEPRSQQPDGMPRRYPTFHGNEAAACASGVDVSGCRTTVPSTFFGTVSRSAMVSSLLALASFMILNMQFQSALGPEIGVMSAAISILGSWLLLAVERLSRVVSLSKQKRWWLRIGAGVLLGTFAFELQESLSVHTPSAAFTLRSVFYQLGTIPLTHAGLDPTWHGYVLFFVAWLAMGGVRREVDEQRRDRLGIGQTARAIVLGFVASFIFAFPQWYAMLWAGMISTTLQLASPWNPSRIARRAR